MDLRWPASRAEIAAIQRERKRIASPLCSPQHAVLPPQHYMLFGDATLPLVCRQLRRSRPRRRRAGTGAGKRSAVGLAERQDRHEAHRGRAHDQKGGHDLVAGARD
jgi:hypothetical protein